jgi:hypothetical protein
MASDVTIRYRLRTLLIVLALGPPLMAVVWRQPALGVLALAELPMLFTALLLFGRHGDRST